ICISGDGGFGHVWSELETLVRLDLPIVLMVLNNQVLGYQMHAELVKFNAYTDACDFKPVDHAMVAEACGCQGIRVDRAADFLPQFKRAMESRKPTLIDVAVDSRAHPPITFFKDRFGSPYGE